MKKTKYILPTTQIPKMEIIIGEYYLFRDRPGGVGYVELCEHSRGKVTPQACSGSKSFLMDIKILEGKGYGEVHLTDFGIEFGTCIDTNQDRSKISTLWENAIRKSRFIMDVYDYVKQGSFVEKNGLISYIVIKAGREDTECARRGAKTIIALMLQAKMLQEKKQGDQYLISVVEQKLKTFISVERIRELNSLQGKCSFDLSKLIKLCENINECNELRLYYAVGMMIRALLDHIPPVFPSAQKWEQVVSNYGGKSFKGSMKTLDGYRDTFDGYLHTQISEKEVTLSEIQVDCSPFLDVLLGEVIRLLNLSEK